MVQKDDKIDIGLERVGEKKRGKGIMSSRTDSLKFNSCIDNACLVSMSSVIPKRHDLSPTEGTAKGLVVGRTFARQHIRGPEQ